VEAIGPGQREIHSASICPGFEFPNPEIPPTMSSPWIASMCFTSEANGGLCIDISLYRYTVAQSPQD
jgi:hypothetical protein